MVESDRVRRRARDAFEGLRHDEDAMRGVQRSAHGCGVSHNYEYRHLPQSTPPSATHPTPLTRPYCAGAADKNAPPLDVRRNVQFGGISVPRGAVVLVVHQCLAEGVHHVRPKVVPCRNSTPQVP